MLCPEQTPCQSAQRHLHAQPYGRWLSDDGVRGGQRVDDDNSDNKGNRPPTEGEEYEIH